MVLDNTFFLCYNDVSEKVDKPADLFTGDELSREVMSEIITSRFFYKAGLCREKSV